MSGAQPVAPARLQVVTTLLSSTIPLNIGIPEGVTDKIRFFLFFLIAYCDTFHDFSSNRPIKGEGKSVSKEDVGNRADFVKNIIKQMEPEIQEYIISLINLLNSSKGFTFENNVYKEFTSITLSPVIDLLIEYLVKSGVKKDIALEQVHKFLCDIYSLPKDSNQQYQCLKKEDFLNVPEASSSLIEIYIPASVYSSGVLPTNLITFLKKIFAECKEGEALKFVEDAASFPRELFTGLLGNFKKIVTTQTKWDPAGLSFGHFENNFRKQLGKIIAPSLLASEGYTQLSKAPISLEFLSRNYFDQDTDTLMRNGIPLKITRPGPSVNHLFMHMIIEKEDLSEIVKARYKQMIKVARFDSKNLVQSLLNGAGSRDDKDKRLRFLTASKRSGDYENIHSALNAGALMFTGDEPAFTYAILNKCPAIYHINTNSTHTFKVYIPPPIDEKKKEEIELKNKNNKLLLEFYELYTIFGATRTLYEGYLLSLQSLIFSGSIKIAGSEEVGRIFQAFFINEFEENLMFFQHLKKASEIFSKLEVKMSEIDTTKYGELNTFVQERIKAFNNLEGKNEQERHLIEHLNAKMAYIKKKIPNKFTSSPSNKPVHFELFRPFTEELINEEGKKIKKQIGEAFLEKGGIRYSFEPGIFFPEYKYLESNFEGIARYMRINNKTTNEVLKEKNIKIIKDILEEFGINVIPTKESLEENFKKIQEEIQKLIHQEGGREGRGRIETKLDIVISDKKILKKKHDAKYYKRIHKQITSLDKSDIPFDFTASEYADILVYRIMINDSIDEINEINKKIEQSAKNTKISDVSIIHRNTNKELVIGKEMLIKDHAQEVQSGGNRINHDELHEYCVYLYTNSIEPFLRKHLFSNAITDEHGSITYNRKIILENILRSIIGGSFFLDLEVFLGDIISSPQFEYIEKRDSVKLFDNMIKSATEAINGIFNKLDTSKIDITSNSGQFPKVSPGEIQKMIDNYKKFSNIDIYDDTFFEYITTACVILSNAIKVKDPPAEGEELKRIKVEENLNEIEELPQGELSKEHYKALRDYINFAVEDYLEFGNFAREEQGKHGGFQTRIRGRKRRRNGSPRRKTLRKTRRRR